MPHTRRGVILLLCAVAVVPASRAPAQSRAAVMVGGAVQHTVAPSETWVSIAARRGVEAATLAADNGATLRTPLVSGMVLEIDTRHIVPDSPRAGIVINIPQRMLFLKAEDEVVASYPVGLGRPDWPTFVGSFTVVNVETDPAWDVPPSIQEELRRAGKRVVTRVGPGPANPLGQYYLALSEPNYGIHGTNAPRSIYRFESHGCIRLHPDDIADLWPRVAVGTPGAIIYEPLLVTIDSTGAVLLEAHRDVYHRDMRNPLRAVRDAAAELGVLDRVDWEAVASVLKERPGRPRDVNDR